MPTMWGTQRKRSHHLQCLDQAYNKQFWKYVAPIPELLEKLETAPPVAEAIMDILRPYQAKRPANHLSYFVIDGLEQQAKP